MSGKISIRVELEIGTDIHEAVHGMCALARKLECSVSADFNDYVFFADPDDSPEEVMARVIKSCPALSFQKEHP